ncbi:hypothetical protein [Sphingomonas sp. GM_Shp_1]|uniref:hypothetical protein n=1 Tax=Sphingomonas sp. GM_Shp_1 TaxID=2937381 RepID=UPI00226B9EF4|nr:hypothetical protein [Sphingomonas sp. GM_Shp_1]
MAKRHMASTLARATGIAALILLGPPLTWLAILWSDPVAWGPQGPIFIYGLAALAVTPGLVGLALLTVRRSTNWLILPLYLVAVALVLMTTLVYFVCIATHDCP